MKRTGLVVLVALSVALTGCDQSASQAPIDLEVREQRHSYAIGVDLANNLQGQDLPIETEALLQGIRDRLDGTLQLSDEELIAVIDDFRTLLSERGVGMAEENNAAGAAFLADNGQRDGVTTTASGLQYEMLEPGDGPLPAATDTVTVHYRGTTLDGTVFDESYARGEPSTFPLNRVIAGWTEGLQLMPVGSKYKFYIASDLAYGDNAPPGADFGPGSTLIFEVELLEIASGQ